MDSTDLRLCGAGEWLAERHGTKRCRSRRKLHRGVDAGSGRIFASALPGREVDDVVRVGSLLDLVAGAVASFVGEGGYDQDRVYVDVAERHPEVAVIVTPRSIAVPNGTAETAPSAVGGADRGQGDRRLRCVAEHGRMGWQKRSGYAKRAKAETFIARWKWVIGDGLRARTDERRLRARTDERRATEVDVAVHALDRTLEPGRPTDVRTA